MSEPLSSLTRGRGRLFMLLSVAIGLLAALLLAEVVLQFLPVRYGIQVATVDDETPVLRFVPDREFLSSSGWDLAIVNRGRINNAGFVNDQDYDQAESTALLAVVGDSYVEAATVPYGETMQGRLAAAARELGRVYSFGASGAPLSQYLIWAEHARDIYDARGIVLVIVGNDFDESLAKYKTSPGLHAYVEAADGTLRLERTDYRPRPWVRLMLNSALARYAVYHLRVQDHLPGLFDIAAQASEPEFIGNTLALASEERLIDSRRAVDAFFRDLPERAGLPPERILFIVDGLRYPDNDPNTQAAQAVSYFAQMRSYFLEQAAKRRYGIQDMDEVFHPHWRSKGQRFDYAPRDGHWNSLGHQLAAEAVMRSRQFELVFHSDVTDIRAVAE